MLIRSIILAPLKIPLVMTVSNSPALMGLAGLVTSIPRLGKIRTSPCQIRYDLIYSNPNASSRAFLLIFLQ